VAYTNGVEAARVRDRSATRGALEFAVGTLQEPVEVHLKSLKIVFESRMTVWLPGYATVYAPRAGRT